MDNPINTAPASKLPSRQIVQVAIQLAALAWLISFCFSILTPFLTPVLWAIILAVSLYPMHQRLKTRFNNRAKPAAILITTVMMIIFIVPAVWLLTITGKEIKNVVEDYQAGRILVPPPPEKVKAWPVIGTRVHEVWRQASVGIDSLIAANPAVAKTVTTTGLALLGSTGKGLLFFAVSIIISGVLLSYSKEAGDFARTSFNLLLGSSKMDMSAVAVVTIRNVLKGIVGVSFIQTAMAAVGMLLAGVPYAGVWTLICLVFAIVQIGTTPVAIGVIIYIWITGPTLTAILLTIWMICIGMVDNFLKPIVMGKGAPVPMLVIFLGSLGGFMVQGFVGLFTGAVVLSLGYRLMDVWIKGTEI